MFIIGQAVAQSYENGYGVVAKCSKKENYVAQFNMGSFLLPSTLLVALACSTSGDQNFMKSLHCADHHPIRIGDGR
jgi:hypothetical protein